MISRRVCWFFSFAAVLLAWQPADGRAPTPPQDATASNTGAGAGWPAQIVAAVGDLGVRFESRSFWTLYRIDYRSTRLCLDKWGSHYGSVLNFPGVGFIGTGHTENEKEQVVELRLLVDGQAVAVPPSELHCREVRLQKRSRIRAFQLDTDVRVCGNRVWEDVRIRADEPTAMKLIYHFMHPWTFTATEYCGELLDGTRVEGVFTGDRGSKIDRPTRWSAIYDEPSGKGAVEYVLLAPEEHPWRTRYWDISQRYRKHYFVTFLGETFPAGEGLRYRMVTMPFAAPAERWKEEAARTAADCRAADQGGDR